jgi:capsular polysaccharide biosynthesis protein
MNYALELIMELKLILKIIFRRWWLVLLPPIMVAAYSIITYHSPAPSYSTTLRFSVGYTPQTDASTLYDKFYPAWLTSEYIAGGLGDWAKTGNFDQHVADTASTSDRPITADEVAGSIVASDHQRSILIVYFSSGDQDKLSAIATASIKVMQTLNGVVFPQNGPSGATVTPLDAVSIVPAPPSLRTRLDIPIRVALGLAFGILLAFIAHYIDPRIRDREEVEALGYKIVGEIPK